MTDNQREIQRKLRVLQHADKIGCVSKTCRYFGIGKSSFYRWRAAYRSRGEEGLKNAKTIPKNPANQTPPVFARSKSMTGISRQMRWILSITLLRSFRSGSARSGPITAMSSRPSSTGMSRTRASVTPTSSQAHQSSTERSSDHTGPNSRSSTNFSATKTMSISKPNLKNGSGFTTLLGAHGAHNGKTPYEALREKL